MEVLYFDEFHNHRKDLMQQYIGYEDHGKIINEQIFTDEVVYSWAPGASRAAEFYYRKSPKDVLPKESTEKIKNYMKVYYQVKNKNLVWKHCIPSELFSEYSGLKQTLAKEVPDSFWESITYHANLFEKNIIHQIAQRKLNVQVDKIEHRRSRKEHVVYRQYASTSRWGESDDSFPIMGLPKQYRRFLKPNNDYFFSADLTAADPSILALLLFPGKYSEYEDVYDFYLDLFGLSSSNREENKRKVFQVVYSEAIYDYISEEEVMNKISHLCNPDGFFDLWGNRFVLPPGKFLLPFIFQSATSNIILEMLMNINEFLADKETELAFTIHDSIVLDVKAEELEEVYDFISENTFSCLVNEKMRYHYSVGENFGEMEAL